MPKPLCFTRPNGLREKKSQKEGPYFSKNDAPLQRQGLFGNLRKLEKSGKTWESWEREARLLLGVVRAIASIRMGVPEACARPARRRSLHELPPRASLMRPKRP